MVIYPPLHDENNDFLSRNNIISSPPSRPRVLKREKQVISAGAIPVFIATTSIRPFREQIDWSAFSFTFAPNEVGPEMIKVLRAVPSGELEEMQVAF